MMNVGTDALNGREWDLHLVQRGNDLVYVYGGILAERV